MSKPKSDKQDIQTREFNGLRYYRHTSDRRGRERGRICLLDTSGEKIVRQIPSFPTINRVYRLRAGLKRFFGDDSFFAEEKLDGYNARIFSHDGELLAATRGGFICPFSTEWIDVWKKEYKLEQFFAGHSKYIICCEICGDNPYNVQRDPNLGAGAHLFVFDIMNSKGEFLAPKVRYDLIKKYKLPTPPLFGKFSTNQVEDLSDILLDLNDRRREGLVLKSGDGKQVVKYVTATTDLDDIRDSLIIDFDLHPRYFRNRFLRAALFVQEFDLDRELYAQRFGEAFMQGYSSLESFNEAKEPYTIYVKREHTWQATRDLIGSQVKVETDAMQPASLKNSKMLRVQFRRVYKKSTHRYHSILKGFPHTD